VFCLTQFIVATSERTLRSISLYDVREVKGNLTTHSEPSSKESGIEKLTPIDSRWTLSYSPGGNAPSLGLKLEGCFRAAEWMISSESDSILWISTA